MPVVESLKLKKDLTVGEIDELLGECVARGYSSWVVDWLLELRGDLNKKQNLNQSEG
jgi:hypothetical protein